MTDVFTWRFRKGTIAVAIAGYLSGKKTEELSRQYFLSEKSVQRIIRDMKT